MSEPTITIPRELFERLVEAVIELHGEKRWMKNEPRERYQEQWAEIDALQKESVALRDREDAVSTDPPQCQRCKRPVSGDRHACPYASEIGDDDNPEFCNCCDDCMTECCQEI